MVEKRTAAILVLAALLAISPGCQGEKDVITNPWLVPYRQRQASAVSRSQMRAMVRLANLYQANGMEKEYLHALTTGVELFAGDIDVTFQLLNALIDKVNQVNAEVSENRAASTAMGIDATNLSRDNLPPPGQGRDEALKYLDSKDKLESLFEESYRIFSTACGQIPYNAKLYYRTADLQYLRARQDGDNAKYKDAINFLKRAIASDSRYIESYRLIALCYERLGDNERAIRFWRLFEVMYEIAPQTMGPEFITPQREAFHREALQHLEDLGAEPGQ